MPGAHSRVKPASACELSASDEASELQTYLQKQLEEDVARIFDESIYSDFEVVCGKLKILTHSCILKARTNKFYNKLEAIVHVNIGRNTFDEIYSFISDAYTECNITHQEEEIIKYLNDNLDILKSSNNACNKKGDTDELEVFLTPKCISPYTEKRFQKSITSSPSTELTKEYYALVPIDSNLLESELIEQDALSNAFHSIIQTQTKDLSKVKLAHLNKPTSLCLPSSHTVQHSSSCDILINDNSFIEIARTIRKDTTTYNRNINFKQNNADHIFNSEHNKETLIEKIETAYSPDSLIADDPSNSSEYLSATSIGSPGIGSSQLNVGDNITKMDFTSSDSGLGNAELRESQSSHKDVSLTESTVHDLTIDEANNSFDTISSSVADNDQLQRHKPTYSSDKDVNPQKIKQPTKLKDAIQLKSSKEEKQRQNEEIVILESSSLSSETGSWESVFPPKLDEKQLCQKFINHEQLFSSETNSQNNKKGDLYNVKEKLGPSLVQKSPFKSTSCFIDAASLVDEEDEMIKVQIDTNRTQRNVKLAILPTPSQPVPCPLAKLDISPNDWSESNEIEDSLEQADKDPDSIQRDLSSTIFEMTPITEDSLCSNAFDSAISIEQEKRSTEVLDITACNTETERLLSSHFLMSNTPHNSIISLKAHNIKQFESEESESEATIVTRDPISLFQNKNNTDTKKQMKYTESSPIVSGGASIEDHLPQVVSNVGSPLNRRKIENIPIVSGAFIPPVEENNHDQNNKLKSSCASAWIIDMSSNRKSETKESITTDTSKNPSNEMFEILKDESDKEECSNICRSNVESETSERSSQKFYIDFSSLPVTSIPKKDNEHENISEKKNIFSMYIDLGEKSTVKDMPARLTSSLNSRRNCGLDTKIIAKSAKLPKNPVAEINYLKDEINLNSSSDFERYEYLCDDPNLSISEIIGLRKKSSTLKDKSEPETCIYSQPNDGDRNLNRTTTETHEDSTTNLFVKLSDLDKPTHKTECEEKDPRMTRSIPDKNWVDHSYSDTSKSIEGIRSCHSENAMSLSRIFPHLKNEFSRSMPLPLSNRTRSPLRLAVSSLGDVDEQRLEKSEISSLHSSTCRSGVENSTTDETSQTSSLIGNCQSRLGQDLLRMFLEEITPDVLVEVAGRRIKAHKCILASRCQYFAAILSGGWVESAGNVIVLPPFSFNVVHFALCHIYSGVLAIPDSISIVELATIADMLGLEGLKEAIMFTLKAKYCHHFHKPCLVCIAGVLECFPLSSVYGLDDLYHKCLKWITKYFTKVWPTKTFATLPKELLDKCYQQHIVNMTTESVVETVYGCGITVASLQNSRWAEIVARMCRRLVNAAAHFVAQRLLSILNQISKMSADTPSPAIQALNDCLAAAIEWAPPDEVCRAYAFLSSLIKDTRIQQFPKYDVIVNGNQYTKVPNQINLLYIHANSWQQKCESALVRAAPRTVGTLAFKELPPDLRKRLRELGCIMYGAQAVPAAVSPQQDRRSQSFNSKTTKNQHSTYMSRNVDIDQIGAYFVPYAPKPTANLGSVRNLRNEDLRDFKKTIRLTPPQVRTTKAQEERAKFNLSKTSQLKERVSNRTSSVRTHLFENTKPRYLEPRVGRENGKNTTVVRKLAPKMVSSSESSRNSSHESDRQRYSKTDRARSRPSCSCETKTHMSQDSLTTTSRPRTAEPSTDSLSESQTSNKFATYTKRRHTSQKESVQSVTKPTNIATVTNKCKGRIPVYLNQHSRVKNLEAKHVNEPQQQASPTNKKALPATVEAQQRIKTNDERRGRVSLMKATKSSTAKMVPKIVKESSPNKLNPKVSMGTTKQNVKRQDNEQLPTKAALSRSGTFLKDEPTFGLFTTTKLDIS